MSDSVHKDGEPSGVSAHFAGIWDHILHPRQRAFLEAYATNGGIHKYANEAAGVSATTSYMWRKKDPEFQEAFRMAEELAPVYAQDAARVRAIVGLRRYQYDRDGNILRHPDQCDCGHDRRKWHMKLDRGAEAMKGKPFSERFYWAQCTHPDCEGCEAFLGEPYYEQEYSDRLLQTLLKGEMPEKYGDKLQVRGVIANINMEALPDVVVARVAAGEDLQAVLVSVLEAGGPDAEMVKGALPEGSEVGRRHRAGRKPGELVQREEAEEGEPPPAGDEGSVDPDDPLGLGEEL